MGELAFIFSLIIGFLFVIFGIVSILVFKMLRLYITYKDVILFRSIGMSNIYYINRFLMPKISTLFRLSIYKEFKKSFFEKLTLINSIHKISENNQNEIILDLDRSKDENFLCSFLMNNIYFIIKYFGFHDIMKKYKLTEDEITKQNAKFKQKVDSNLTVNDLTLGNKFMLMNFVDSMDDVRERFEYYNTKFDHSTVYIEFFNKDMSKNQMFDDLLKKLCLEEIRSEEKARSLIELIYDMLNKFDNNVSITTLSCFYNKFI